MTCVFAVNEGEGAGTDVFNIDGGGAGTDVFDVESGVEA